MFKNKNMAAPVHSELLLPPYQRQKIMPFQTVCPTLAAIFIYGESHPSGQGEIPYRR